MNASLGRRLLAAGVLLAAAASASAEDPFVAEIYEVTVPMGPVCVDGTYPLELLLDGSTVDGEVTATTDVRGRLVGSAVVDGAPMALAGKVKYRDGAGAISLILGKGAARLVLKGEFDGGSFSGTSTGSGKSAAPGKNLFTLDTSGAPPQEAILTAVLDEGGGTSVTGTAEALVCGGPLELSVKGKRKSSLSLTLSAKGFRWKAAGGESGTDVSWTVKGFGAKRSGDGLPLEILLPPSGLAYPGGTVLFEQEETGAPVTPVVGGGRVKVFTVDPALPEGVLMDPATGTLSGTPPVPADTVPHTVTATNAAGSSSTVVSVGVRIQHAYSLAPHAETLTDEDLRHFLVRTHFGVRPSEQDELATLGLPAFVDLMLDVAPDAAFEATARRQLVNASDPPGLEGGFPSRAQVARWWTWVFMNTDRPFRENIALFWQDHFAVSSEVLAAEALHWMERYGNLLRDRGTGNLRDLLLDVSMDAAMLEFLNGHQNAAGRPNENFAREFWELYTLGVDNGYTQEDIVEAARAFTGFRARLDINTGQHYSVFETNRHDGGAKTLLGVTIPAQNVTHDFAAVVDITLEQRPVAEFICRKLLRWYCYDDPPESLVADMAQVLRDNDYELAPALRAMFLSEAFFSKRARRALVKSPVDFGVGFVRSTGLVISPSLMDFFLTGMGQRISEPPTVNGWPANTLWISAAAMVDRTNLAQIFVQDVVNQGNAGITVADILPPVGQRSAGQVVDRFAELLRIDLTAEDRTDLVDFLNTIRLPDGSVVSSPFSADNPVPQDDRIRGLLYVMAQHPDYHLR